MAVLVVRLVESNGMLRVVEMASAEGAKSYYTDALARADYYAQGHEVVGVWRGHGAERLGLRDKPVDQSTFSQLIDNRHPQYRDRSLTPRTRTDRRPGYDLNFHSPKGLSVLAALTGDHRIYEAFQHAVRETMAEMEQAMQVRVRSGHESGKDRTTGNWIYSEFLHLTARPTNEAVPDPHLHMHCCVINASYDATEQSWKAGQFGAIKRDASYYEAAFHARLARSVAGLGYRIERRAKYWDLADVPETLVEKFSKRKGLIEKVAEKRGITDAQALDRLGAETRQGKRQGLSNIALKQAWASQLSPQELSALRSVGDRAAAQRAEYEINDEGVSVRNSVNFAISHTFERQSVAGDKQLAETALRHGLGFGVEVARVWQELKDRCAMSQLFRRSIDDQQLCTTREAYEETTRCIAYAREGMGCCRALAPDWEVLCPELLVGGAADQRAAIEHVLTSTDRVIAVQGRAGTGKTFATQEISAALAASGHRLQALAPTSKAVDVLRKEGFGDADTVSQLLINSILQEQVEGGVLLIDEAGLLSTRQMDQLFQLARARSCRVLLQYDLSQHRSVERGSPVRDLERYAGLTAAEIHVVRRQKRQDYAAAVKDLSRGEFQAAFERLKTMEAFSEVHDSQERVRLLASDYLAATRVKGTTALVVSPTHKEGDAVTQAIRHALRTNGRLKGDECDVSSLRRAGFTAAQRGEHNSYTEGQIIQFQQNTSGYQRGDRLVVRERRADGKVIVQRTGSVHGGRADACLELPLSESASFDVYECKSIALSLGDRIRISQNGYVPVNSAKDASSLSKDGSETALTKSTERIKSKPPQRRLINGAMYTITRFTKKGDLVLDNGWVLPRSYGHIAHGYCTTSHASQGMTADTVLISQSTESFRASSREQFYVSCSRGRTGIKIYTDSVAELSQAVRRSHQQTSAADLMLATAAPEQSLEIQSSRRKSAASVRHQRTLQTAVSTVQHGRDHLHIASDRGSAVVVSDDGALLKTGAKSGSSVLIPTEPPGKRTFVNHVDEWVCGPHVSMVTEKIRPGDNSKKLKPAAAVDAASNSPAKKTVFVRMFSSEPESQFHHPSI